MPCGGCRRCPSFGPDLGAWATLALVVHDDLVAAAPHGRGR